MPPFKNLFLLDFVTTDKEDVKTVAYNEIESPKIGSQVIVEVTCIVSPSCFYVIMPYGTTSMSQLEKNNREIIKRAENEENLDSLCRELTKYYNSHTFSASTPIFTPGEVVVGRCSKDKRWYGS